MKPIFVCQHTPNDPPARLGALLDRRCLPWIVCCQYEANPPAFDADAHAGLVVLGGPMNADETERHPFLAREIAWLRAALSRHVPVLGICLGAQLLARALDASVACNRVAEIGWLPITVTAEGSADPLLRPFAPTATVFHWHYDTFDLPTGAVHLAYSADCAHQAFRFGDNAYGVQFHPEVTGTLLANWCSGLDAATAAAVAAPTPTHLPASAERMSQLLAAWLRSCGTDATQAADTGTSANCAVRGKCKDRDIEL